MNEDTPTLFMPYKRERILDGRYRLVSLLKQGAQADIYLADDIQAGESSAPAWVVIKEIRFPHALPANETIVKRFQREQRLLRDIRHRHVVRYFGSGSTPRSLWIAEEYAPEGSLGDELRRRWELRTPGLHYLIVLTYVRQALDALDSLHGGGIIHRDIKPDNMLLFGKPSIAAPYTKLTDFGLAHLYAATEDLTGQATVGTEMYMAPEQLDGECLPASDLYSLAAVAYEAMTGFPPRAPWQGYETMLAFNDHIPQSVDDIIARGLLVDIGSEARYPTARHFMRAIATILG